MGDEKDSTLVPGLIGLEPEPGEGTKGPGLDPGRGRISKEMGAALPDAIELGRLTKRM